jgi:hypothetical protein
MYHFEISNRLVALENLEPEVDINRAWETIREIWKENNTTNRQGEELSQRGIYDNCTNTIGNYTSRITPMPLQSESEHNAY